MTVRDVAARLRQPEYTGENRCLPCTVVNLCLAAVVAGIVAAVWMPPVGGAVFAVSVLLIYIRGYLVPGTPTLTKRYFPSWLLSLFGKEATVDEPVETTVGGISDQLFERNVLTRDVDTIKITGDFRADWKDRISALNEIHPNDVGAMFDAETVTRHGETSFVVDGAKSVRWESAGALLSDVAADELLEDRLADWSATEPDNRETILKGLRFCLDTCPTCGGRIDVEEERVDPCCDRPRRIAQAVCTDCGELFADAAVVDDDGTKGIKQELLSH